MAAAVATVELGPGSAWASWKFANRDWQIEAWRLYDIIPELRFLAGWIGDSVSQARLYVTEINENGEETGETKDARIAKLAALPLGTGSQRDDNLRLLGIDLAVGGEAWVVGEGAMTDDPQGWFVLSGAQLMRTGDDINVRRPMATGGGILTLQDGADVLIRAWRPHPNDIAQSDSPTRSAIPALREIELLTKREFAELESRLTGPGVWPIPEGWDFPRGEGDPEGMTGSMAFLQRTMAENIRDQSQASALVPIMFTIPDHMVEHLDKVKPINFWSELSDQIIPMKEKAIVRVAASYEIPSELLTGLGDSNHWSAWAVSEEGIKRCKPYLATIADTLTRGFLIPTLERAGVENPERYAYAFDVAPLAVRPNRLTEALELWDRLLISDKEAVQSGAFTEGQMPKDDERLKMLIFRAVTANPQLLADPAIQAAIGLTGPAVITPPAAPEPREIEAPEEENAPPDEPDDPGAAPADAPTNTAQAVTLIAAETSAPSARFLTCKVLMLRALELAGGRLATNTQRRGPLAGVPRHELHIRLGPIAPERAEKVLEGAWEHVSAVACDLQVDPAVMTHALHAHARELLRRGLGYADSDLEPVVRRMGRIS
jgi:hypothetical protein